MEHIRACFSLPFFPLPVFFSPGVRLVRPKARRHAAVAHPVDLPPAALNSRSGGVLLLASPPPRAHAHWAARLLNDVLPRLIKNTRKKTNHKNKIIAMNRGARRTVPHCWHGGKGRKRHGRREAVAFVQKSACCQKGCGHSKPQLKATHHTLLILLYVCFRWWAFLGCCSSKTQNTQATQKPQRPLGFIYGAGAHPP